MNAKFIKSLILAIASIASLASCDTLNTISKQGETSQGSAYEVIVVCNQPEWEAAGLGATVDSLLSANVEHIYREEPQFTMLHIPFANYKDLIAKHRNIITIEINAAFKEPKMITINDVAAQPQVVINIKAGSAQAAKEFFLERGAEITATLEREERMRDVMRTANYKEPAVGEVIKRQFGISMNVPQGYTVRQEDKNFVWASYELPLTSQGFMIYTYPADEEITSETILNARNMAVKSVPGPSEGSYMTTSEVIAPVFTPLNINGRVWYEQRGLWCVANDFMGGPYVSYSTLDAATNRVIVLDCYVYSPKKDLRNYLREVEHLIYGVEIPTAAAQVTK